MPQLILGQDDRRRLTGEILKLLASYEEFTISDLRSALHQAAETLEKLGNRFKPHELLKVFVGRPDDPYTAVDEFLAQNQQGYSRTSAGSGGSP
jgi:hypothetical protein